ncbi:MAG TPA: hypothetical protein VFQ85_00765 [Mycobacteriales bacterium]|jgi:hypothetical protein|nr:hypothetical protein [Mycobacteriales bacterium]
MNDVRTTLDQALATEPPLVHRLDDVVAAGRAARRRRRTMQAVGSVATVVAVAGVATLVAARPQPVDRLTPAATAPTTAPATAPAATTGKPLTPRQQALADAIRNASPAGWTFQLSADRFTDDDAEGLRGVEATADDGAGPGRLMIGLSTATQLLHPCRDSEFPQGASCVERALADGSVLTLRGQVDWRGPGTTPTSTVMAVLTHPDGSGIIAESGDFTITWPIRQGYYTPEQKRATVHHSRSGPTYTVEQLADVVLAINAALAGS